MKKNLSRRLLAMLLCVVLCVSLLPVSAFADEGEEAEAQQSAQEQVGETAQAPAEPETPDEPEDPETPEVPAAPVEAPAAPQAVTGIRPMAEGDEPGDEGENDLAVTPWASLSFETQSAGTQNKVTVTVPMENDGVTLRVTVTANDLSGAGAWGGTIQAYYEDTEDLTGLDALTPVSSSDAERVYECALGQLTEPTQYVIVVRDGLGNEITNSFYCKLDNAFSVSVADYYDDWSVGDQQFDVNLTVQAGEAATLQFAVSAADDSNLNIYWVKGYWMDGDTERLDGETGTSYTTPALTEDVVYQAHVNDPYGNIANIFYHITVEQTGGGSTPAFRLIAEDDWVVEDDGDGFFDATITLPMENDGVTLNFEASGDKAETFELSVGPKSGGAENVALEPVDAEAEVWVYTYTIPAVTTPMLISYQGDYGQFYIHIRLDNAFSLSAEDYYDDYTYDEAINRGEVGLTIGVGETATLQFDVSVEDEEGLSIKWYRQEIDEEDPESQQFVLIDEATGETSYTTPALTQDSTYYVQVNDAYGNFGRIYYNITVSEGGIEPPEEYTELAITDLPLSVRVGANEQVWYLFTAPATKEYYFYTDSGRALALDMWDEQMNPLNGGQSFYEDADESAGAELWAELDEGEVYYLSVRSYQGAAASATLAVRAENNLRAWSELENQTVQYGESAWLSVTAVADVEDYLSFSWYGPDGALLEVTDEAEYCIESVERAGTYRCVVRDGFGNEETVALEVRIDNYVGLHPRTFNTYYLLPGETQLLETAVDGPGDLEGIRYQWYEQTYSAEEGYVETAIAGATASSYTTPRFDGKPHVYICKTTDRYGNEDDCPFYIKYKNNFSIEPVLSGGWVKNERGGSAEITVPVSNTGVTMQVQAKGDKLGGVTYEWWCTWGDGGAAEVLSDTESATLRLGPVSGYVGYTVHASDGLGNEDYFDFIVRIENGLSVSPVLQEGWTVDDYGNVQILLPFGNEGVTLAADVQADDESDMQIVWRQRDEWDDWNDLEEETGTSIETGPIDSAAAYSIRVTDRYGNPAELVFEIKLDNGFHVESVPQSDWDIWKDPDGSSEYVSGTLAPDNDGVTLQIRVDATDKSDLTVFFYDNSGPATALEPDDPSADTWTYSWIFDEPLTAGLSCGFDVDDGYGSRYYVGYNLSVDNAFYATAKNGDYVMKIPVAVGKTAKLELDVRGNDLSKLNIGWVDVSTEKLLSSGTSTSITTPKITKSTMFRAYIDDGYGNDTFVYFYVYVNNKLSLSSANGVAGAGGRFPLRMIELNADGSVALKVTASATKTTGLKISWYDTAPTENNELYGFNSAPLATTSGKTSTYQVKNVTWRQIYYAMAEDTYGNREILQFIVQVKNDLHAYVSGTDKIDAEIRVDPGSPLTLSVDATAADPEGLTYSWTRRSIRGGSVVLDETGPTCTIDSVDATMSYNCSVTDKFGNTAWVYFSVVAENHLRVAAENDRYTLALRAGETATIVPVLDAGEALPAGENVLPIYVTADDMEGVTVTWLRINSNGSLMPVETDGNTVVTAPVSAETGAQRYHLTVSDRYNNYVSSTIYIELDNHFSATAASPVVTVNSGKKATLKVKVTADDTSGVTYQWYADGLPVSGATKASYTTPAVKQQTRYACQVTDRFGGLAFVYFTVKVQNKLAVTAASPTTQFVAPGASATMAVKATAKKTAGLSYAWYEYTDGFTDEVLGTEASYTVYNVTSTRYFFCEVTDFYGNTEEIDFCVGVDNGFSVGAEYGRNAYTVFKGEEQTLTVDVALNDASDYVGTWSIYRRDNAAVWLQPLQSDGLMGDYDADGVWRGTDSYTAEWSEEGVYEVLYTGVDVTGMRRSQSFTITVLTLKDYVPAAPATEMRPNGVAVNFDAVPENIGDLYTIERKTGSGKFAVVATLNVEDAEVEDNGTITWVDETVKNNTKYSYRVTVSSDEGGSSKTGAASAVRTAYLPPVLKAPVAQANGVKLSWAKVAGAAAYRVYRQAGGETGWTVAAQKVTATNYVDKAAVSGAENRYLVCALDKKGNEISALQEESVGVFFLTSPVVTGGIGLFNLSIQWAPVQGAVTYEVERKVGKGAFEPLPAASLVDATASHGVWLYNDNSVLEDGATYTYRVTAVDGEGHRSVEALSKSFPHYLPPAIKSADATATGVKVSWAKLKAAKAYRVWRSTDGGENWTVVAQKVTALTWVDTAPAYGAVNAYRVQALDKSGSAISKSSEEGSAQNSSFLAAPTVLSASVTAPEDFGGVTVKWSGTEGVSFYSVLRKTGKGAWEELASVDGQTTSYKDRTAVNKTAYTYAVQAFADSGMTESKISAGKSATYYQAPGGITVTEAAQGATIAWTAVPGAAKYSVLRWDDLAGQWVVAAKAVSGTSYNDKNAQYEWAYTVQALNKSGKAISSFDPTGAEFLRHVTPPEPQPSVTLTLAVPQGQAGDPCSIAVQAFKEAVEEQTAGTVQVEIAATADLAGALEGVAFDSGEANAIVAEASYFAVYDDEADISADPFRFSGFEDAWAFMDGDRQAAAEEPLLDQNIRVLAHYDGGFRMLSANRTINAPADLQDLRIRVPNTTALTGAMTALGASPVTMAYSELRTALGNGTIDGMDGTVAAFYRDGFQEVQSCLAATYHSYIALYFAVSDSVWQTMSAAQRQIVLEAAQSSALTDRQQSKADTESTLETLAGLITVTYPELAAFQSATASLRRS
ncbi:MAG: TRAP transporter substrate-binding protein DctP [Oscillospiraceae bacterium]|nr:TRAP transporter substrate-binding protein DctP [Oscillospiraceae bacterium]